MSTSSRGLVAAVKDARIFAEKVRAHFDWSDSPLKAEADRLLRSIDAALARAGVEP